MSPRGEQPSVFVRKDVRQPNFELTHHGFQLVDGEVMLALFNAEQGHVGDAGFLSKLGIRQLAPGFAQEQGQLTIHAVLHPFRVSKQS